MRAIVISKPGGPAVLELREVATPQPSRGEVRVRVRATAVNRADVLQRMGKYPAPPGAPTDIPGLEFAGEVDVVGDDATEWAPGDRVFGVVGGGSYAEHIVVHARTLARLPRDIQFTDAAAVPEAFVTAWDAMVEQAALALGETVLVHAVGSGVGTAAIQLAKALGARVLGTARTPDKLERARDLGLVEGMAVGGGSPNENSRPLFASEVLSLTQGAGADVILDLVGGAYVAEDVACVASKGRIVVVGALAGTRAEIDLTTLMKRRARIYGTVLRSRPLEEKIMAAIALERRIVPLLVRRAVRPVIERVLTLDKAAEAHRMVESNDTFGKIVLEV